MRIDELTRFITRHLESKEMPSEDEVFRDVKKHYEIFKKSGLLDSEEIEDQDDKDIINSIFIEVHRKISIFNPSDNEAFLIRDEDSEHDYQWYNNFTNNDENFYWYRYEKYLRENTDIDGTSIASMDKITTDVLNSLGDPRAQAENFNRRGMLLGDVQSGKTTNIAGIITKAADAGYNYIVLLTSNSNDLRSQTQKRIDEAFCGFSLDPDKSEKKQYFGVSEITGKENSNLDPSAATNLRDDFDRKHAETLTTINSGNQIPTLFVMKKNKNNLENFLSWQKSKSDDHKKSILVIDDECDYASINYNDMSDENSRPTAINQKIREFISKDVFYKSSYLAVTATPFANLFIDTQVNDIINENDFNNNDEISLGRDIFPRDFIKVTISPSSYLGPSILFKECQSGSQEYPSNYNHSYNEKHSQSEKMIRILPGVDTDEAYSDWQREGFIPYGNRNSIEGIPESLKHAIRIFFISNGIHDLDKRNLKKHLSMLVNAAVKNEEHESLNSYIYEYIQEIKNDLKNYGIQNNKESNFLAQLQDDYNKEFGYLKNNWNKVLKSIIKSSNKIKVQIVNGRPDNEINFHEESANKEPHRVIIVGGHKLSRGLTIEGLCITYLVRRPTAADTLLQLGRFFGYRNSLRDYSRIYLTEEAFESFQEINSSLEALKSRLRSQNLAELTPIQFTILVKSCFGIQLTAAQKRRGASLVTIIKDLSEKRISNHAVYNDDEKNNQNRKLLVNLISDLGIDNVNKDDEIYNTSHNYLWKNIDQSYIRRFVSNFHIPQDSAEISRDFKEKDTSVFEEYMERISQSGVESLDKWDVLIFSTRGKNNIDSDLNDKIYKKTNHNFEINSSNKKTFILTDQVVRLGGMKFDIAWARDFLCGIEKRKLLEFQFINPTTNKPSQPLLKNINGSVRSPLKDELLEIRKNPMIIIYNFFGEKNQETKIIKPIISFAIQLPKVDDKDASLDSEEFFYNDSIGAHTNLGKVYE